MKKKIALNIVSFVLLICMILSCFLLYNKIFKVNNDANISYNNMDFIMSINSKATDIVKAASNDESFYNISITSLNNYNIKYELVYDVCEDQKCNKILKQYNKIDIKYSSETINKVSGTITPNGNINIRIIILNSNKKSYYIKFKINVSKNKDLALVGQINTKYKEENLTIASYIYGELNTSFPTVSGFATSVECKTNGKKSNAIGYVSWDTTNLKWKLQIKGIDEGVTRCNIYFNHTIIKDAIMDNNTVANPLTTPGTQSSGSNESVLASSTDDYGTTYYFRGAVQNNFIKFANMCWRAVRITGNYAVKIILYNYNPNNVSNPCDSAYNGDYNAFAHNTTDTYTSQFNTSSSDNTYVGFMYGNTGSTNYSNTHANINKSTILQYLETWYSTHLSNYSSKLNDVIWCNDKSFTTGSLSKSMLAITTNYTTLGYGSNLTLYGGTGRLTANGIWSSGGTGPTFICPNDALGGKLSKFTVADTINGNGKLTYPIGLITADEMTYAGFLYGFLSANTSYYLYQNSNDNWWSMTPMNYMHYLLVYYPVVWFSSTTGAWEDYIGVTASRAVRPVVALNGDDRITSGVGTAQDPYVIEEPSES